MSHITSSRMPHAYAQPSPKAENDGIGTVKADADASFDLPNSVSRGAWMLGALGIGAVGAMVYATLRSGAPAPKKRRGPGRKSANRRARAAA